MPEKPITIVGIKIRTSNAKAAKDISTFWEKFWLEGVMEEVEDKVSEEIFAVYTDFENEGVDNEGEYTFIIGLQVGDMAFMPKGYVSYTIEPAKREVFEVEAGHPEKVGEKWEEIWTYTNLGNTYKCDYEHYKEDGEINIYVGIE